MLCEVQLCDRSLLQCLWKLQSEVQISIWYYRAETPCNWTISLMYNFTNLSKVDVFSIGRKWDVLVSLSTTTQIALNPACVLCSPTMKSILTWSHLRNLKYYNVPLMFYLHLLAHSTPLQISHNLFLHSVPLHLLWYISVLPDGQYNSNHVPHIEAIPWTLRPSVHKLFPERPRCHPCTSRNGV